MILAIETATDVASVAVVDAAGVRAEFVRDRPREALRWLIVAIDGVLAAAGVTADRITAVAVSAGPGSFTGLRVGIATAAGWARAADTVVRAVPTLEAMAWRAPRAGVTVPILDARRGEVAFAAFSWRDGEARRLVAETTCPPDEAAAIVASAIPPRETATLLGDGLRGYRGAFLAAMPDADVLPEALWTPRAARVGAVGARLLASEGPTATSALLPAYGRAPRLRGRGGGEETPASSAKR